MRNIFFTMVACALWCGTGHAAGPIIGPLCMEGVTSKPHSELASPQGDGIWTPTDYRLDPKQSSVAKLIVFDRPIPLIQKFETCRDVAKRMADAGALPVVSGKLSDLTLRALIFVGPSGNRIQLNRDSFRAVLSNVDSGVRSVAGGTIDFRGSKLWIKPSVDVLSTATGIEGEFEIEAWNRKILDARIVIGQGLTYTVSLAAKNESNVTVRINLQDGRTVLWAGDLFGQPLAVASGDMYLPSLTLKAANLKTNRIGVNAANGILHVALSGVSGSTSEALIPGPELHWKTRATSIAIANVDSKATQESKALVISHADFLGLTVRKAPTMLVAHDGAELFTGISDMTFAKLFESERAAKSTWTAVNSKALLSILPSGISRMNWNENGLTEKLTVDGQLDVERLKLGGMDLSQRLEIKITPSSLLADLVIPIKAEIPAASGSISFLNGDQTVAIQGRLDKFAIDGKLVIPLSDIEASRLEIAKNGLSIAVGAAVSLSPFVAGTKPNFLDAKLSLTNDSDIRVAKVNTAGTALLVANTLLLAQPVLKIGDNGTRNPATIDFKSEGVAKLRYNLASGKSTMMSAKLSASDVTFSLLGPPPRVLDLGGDQISDPVLSLKKISIEIDQLGAIKVERAELEKLSITASALVKPLPPGATSGVTYSGELSRPMTIEMARAGRVSIDDAIIISGFELNALDIGVSNASVSLGDGFTIARGSLDFGVLQTREVTVLDRSLRELKDARLAVAGRLGIRSPSVSINDAIDTKLSIRLDGQEDALNGKGSLRFGPFSGYARSPLVIKFDCRGTGQLNVQMETNFALIGGDFEAQMQNGKITAEGSTGPFVAAAHSLDPNTGCDNPVTKHVVQRQGEWWTDGICSRGFEIYHCRWESPEISYAYHIHLAVRNITATVAMSNPRVYMSGNEMRVCNLGAAVVTPLVIAGGYSPGIDSPYPGLDNIVNGLIQIGFEPIQSLGLTGLGQGLGWFLSSAATAAGNALCIGKPI